MNDWGGIGPIYIFWRRPPCFEPLARLLLVHKLVEEYLRSALRLQLAM
jgi:hypothetical protein